jgi:myo-inositol-1(or 4)-monophosphatase
MSLPDRAVLEDLATRAGAIALRHFRQATPERKADRTLVTAADREVEAFLASEFERLWPEAGIVGEEGTSRAGSGPYRIAIDPVDGTSAFVAGLASWCVCVGVLRDGEPVAGVVYLPVGNETYSATEGRAWWNGRPLPPLGTAATSGDPFVLVDAKSHRRQAIRYEGKIRSLGSSAYHVALVARGAAEAALVGRAHVWDLAAPAAVLAAVGGRLGLVDGGSVDLGELLDGRRTRDYVVAAAADRLDAMRPLLGGVA